MKNFIFNPDKIKIGVFHRVINDPIVEYRQNIFSSKLSKDEEMTIIGVINHHYDKTSELIISPIKINNPSEAMYLLQEIINTMDELKAD